MNLTLPFPPSVNGLYRDGGHGKRPKTDRYKQWCVDAMAMMIDLSGNRLPRFHGNVRIELYLKPPDKRSRGLDNYLKAPLDLLVDAGVIENDEEAVRKITTEWTDVGSPGCTIILLAA